MILENERLIGGKDEIALFEVKEVDKRIYEEELKDFLPERIIDIHTHLWRQEYADEINSPSTLSGRGVRWPSLVAATNPIEDLQETYRLMFPGKEVSALCFTTRIPYDRNNAYVAKSTAQAGWYCLYSSDPMESGESLERHIREGGFLGVKCYLSRAPKYLPTKEIRIFDFFPKHQLEKLNQMKAIVMLHIPRDGRLKDPVNLAQIKELKQEFPDVKLIVAHIGRAYVRDDIGNAFEELAECKDLLFDFSANCSEYAMTKLLEAVEPERVLFGSDMPILRMRTRRIEENGTYINLVPPGLYGDPSQDSHLREVSPDEAETITFFMYEEILAFKRTAEKMGLSRENVENIFYGNAKRLLDNAHRDIYGE